MSGDEVFEGFTLEELAEAEQRRIMKDEETVRVIRELESAFDSDSTTFPSATQQHDIFNIGLEIIYNYFYICLQSWVAILSKQFLF